MKTKDYKRYIYLEKNLEDMLDDVNLSLFTAIFNVTGNKPAFTTSGLFTASVLDNMLVNKFGERWLNKAGADGYTVVNNVLTPVNSLASLATEITDYYYKKWDNLFYLYYTIVMGSDYNPIENYSSNETTTFNNVKDVKSYKGSEKDSQNQQVQERPLALSRTITDEYGTASGGSYINGIKDERSYSRNYTETSQDGIPASGGGTATPHKTTTERQVQGLNSSSYQNSEKDITDELGQRSRAFTDNVGSGETTERTGKHTTGETVANNQSPTTTRELTAAQNYIEKTFTNRTDENERTGNITVDKSGNIGVMTASQILESAWAGELARNFLDVVLRDVTDYLTIAVY